MTWSRLKAVVLLMGLAYGESCQLSAASHPPLVWAVVAQLALQLRWMCSLLFETTHCNNLALTHHGQRQLRHAFAPACIGGLAAAASRASALYIMEAATASFPDNQTLILSSVSPTTTFK